MDERKGMQDARTAEDEEAPLRERGSPWSVQDMVNEDLHKQLMASIQRLLLYNMAIPEHEQACTTIPEAIMRLPTPPGALPQDTFRHQYPIPQRAQEAVDETVKLWIANGFVIPSSASSEYNTAIMAAKKKSLDGLHTAWRICLDYRHVNSLLLSKGPANARMPQLNEVLQRLSGFTQRQDGQET
jgi:hypothetical protein